MNCLKNKRECDSFDNKSEHCLACKATIEIEDQLSKADSTFRIIQPEVFAYSYNKHTYARGVPEDQLQELVANFENTLGFKKIQNLNLEKISLIVSRQNNSSTKFNVTLLISKLV